MSADTHQPMTSDAAEPKAVRDTVPVWLIILFFVLLWLAMVYFDQHGGWFNEHVYMPYTRLDNVEHWQPPKGGDDLYALGKQVYNKPTCVTCHQADGNGTPGQFPPLAGSGRVSEAEPGRLIRIVLNGRQAPITVSGKSFNGVMVPWKDQLSDKEVAAVLTYVRGNKDWGNKFPPVKPEQVAAVRAKVKDRNPAFTPDELLKLSPSE